MFLYNALAMRSFSGECASDESSRPKPIFLEIRSSTWFIVVTVCVAAFSDAFTYGVIIPVLPYRLKAQFGVLDDEIQFWNSLLLASFGTAQFLFSPLFGHFADRSDSRRSPLLLGFFGNAAATALLYFARNLWLLVLSRFLQGLSAAIVYTVGFALLADTVGQESIGQWMGFVFTTLNAGMMISPAMGGIIYDNFGYESLFVAIFLLIAIDVVLRLIMIEKKVALGLRQPIISEAQAVYGTLASNTDVVATQEQDVSKLPSDSATNQESPLLSPPTPPPQTKNNARHPILTLFASPRILTTLYGAIVTVTVLVAFDAALPIFVEKQFGWGPTGGGLIFLAITLPISLSPLAGRLADQYTSSYLTAFWFGLSAVSTIGLLLATNEGIAPARQKVLLCILLAVYGFANTFGSAPLSTDLSRAVAEMEAKDPGIFGGIDATAQVYSLFTSASAAGVLVGPTLAVVAYGDHDWRVLVTTLGLLTTSIAVPVLLVNVNARSKTAEPKGTAEIEV